MNLSHYRSILCLDGDLPDAAFFKQNLPIIAADGAANKLMNLGIKPIMVIGDLDAISAENKEKLPLHYDYDQNYSDYQKSLKYISEHNLSPSIVVGINGGYIDHILNNVNIFMGTDHLLYAPPIYGKVLQQGAMETFTLPLNTKISILGIPSANVTSSGLQWELARFPLAYPGQTSCFNRSIAETVTFQIHEGAILILIYEAIQNKLF